MAGTHFKAMSVLGCEKSSLARRERCKHNCCDGENCILWLDRMFRRLEDYENTGLTPEEITERLCDPRELEELEK